MIDTVSGGCVKREQASVDHLNKPVLEPFIKPTVIPRHTYEWRRDLKIRSTVHRLIPSTSAV